MHGLKTCLSLLLFGLLSSAAVARTLPGAMIRPLPVASVIPGLTVLNYHDVVDDLREAGASDSTAITTDHLIAHFDWLLANGFHVVSFDQVAKAMDGGGALPAKSVLLTFDDGLQSEYTRVLPLLQAYGYPALMALEGSWMDLPEGTSFNYNGKQCDRGCFVSWAQVREMQASGLVEIASHTWDLHQGIVSNPQRNLMPAAVSLAYDTTHARYEDATGYSARVHADLKHSADEIEKQTGRRPRAIAWPYGAYNRVAKQVAASVGLTYSLSLDDADPSLAPAKTIPRVLVPDNIGVQGLAALIYDRHEVQPQRVIQVDLDYVYDADPAQQERNLSALLDRIKRMAPSQVWLQAYADPDGDGVADSVYFPNRHLPMRADLFSRVAWQLQTRCKVQVYAWLPVMAYRFKEAQNLPSLGASSPKPGDDGFRLAPWDPRVRQLIGDVYEDLAMHANFAGLLFSDDAFMRDSDQLGPWATHTTPQRTLDLIEFTRTLAARAQQWRTQIKTARNLYAKALLQPAAQAWFAQSLPAFLNAYDYVGLMAMPQLDKQAASNRWFRQLVAAVAREQGGLDRTVFELASKDWRSGQPIAAKEIGRRMRLLQEQGARHVGYYPDDFLREQPQLEVIRPFISASDFPYEPR